MSEQSPVGANRSLDVFDPQPDGVAPYTLVEVVDAAGAVYESLVEFQKALLGCGTPLNLGRQDGQAEQMKAQAIQWFETLSAVREIVERDLPLADSYPDGDGTVAEEREWTGLSHSGRSLSPAEILRFNALAPEWPFERLTTYRREIQRDAKVPSLISSLRREAEQAAEEAEKVQLGPDATPDQLKAAANAKRAKTRAANKAAKEETRSRDRGPVLSRMFPDG